MKTKIIITLLLFSGFLAFVLVSAQLAEDRNSPQITFEKEDRIYTPGMSEEELLLGVTAYDDRDADVTESLKIEAVYENSDENTAMVIYVAKDSENNVTKVSEVFDMSQAADTGGDQAGEAAQVFPEESSPDSESEVETEVGEDAQTDSGIPEEQQAAIDSLAPENPRIYLTDYELDVPVGFEFNALSYVDDIQDDVDSTNDLWTRIQLSGEVDTQEAGEYVLQYLAVDSDGNQSNLAALTVTVS